MSEPIPSAFARLPPLTRVGSVASSSGPTFPTTTELVDKVPLIKSPSFWVPKPVELPQDVHPLPDDITAYVRSPSSPTSCPTPLMTLPVQFVYPHTLENYVLTTLPAALQSLEATHAARLSLLASVAESKERARKVQLNRLAPGWSEGGVMEPMRKNTVSPSVTTDLLGNDDDELVGSPKEMGINSLDQMEKDQMQALVDGLAAMDGERTRQQASGDLI